MILVLVSHRHSSTLRSFFLLPTPSDARAIGRFACYSPPRSLKLGVGAWNPRSRLSLRSYPIHRPVFPFCPYQAFLSPQSNLPFSPFKRSLFLNRRVPVRRTGTTVRGPGSSRVKHWFTPWFPHDEQREKHPPNRVKRGLTRRRRDRPHRRATFTIRRWTQPCRATTWI